MQNQASNKLSADVVFQALVLVPMLICYLGMIFEVGMGIGALLIQLAVGGVQLLSGVIFSLAHKSRFHQKYLAGAILYLVFLFFILAGGNQGDSVFPFLFVIFNCIIPVGIAIWYIVKSYDYHKNYQKPETTKIKYTDDTLLDDQFQLNG